MSSVIPRGRYAPSPTGAIHLGNARTALLAWLDARATGARFVMRVEDLDAPRIQPGAEAAVLADLAWLWLDWDEGPDVGGPFAPYRQSERAADYDAAIARLLATGQAFPCACTRADVARAASAPQEPDDDGLRYPGTCRALPPAAVEARAVAQGRRAVVRFAGGAVVGFDDLVHGRRPGDPRGVDDFVLRRADGTAAYQLAVVVDDAAMVVTRVVRGDDLLSSTPRQVALYSALGLPLPAFAHVPLVLAPGGARLAKRTRPLSIGALRARGIAPDAVIGLLASSAGLCPAGTRAFPRALVDGFDIRLVDRRPAVIDGHAIGP